MGASLTDTLCTRCALCCDGTLFADVELAGAREATKVEILGLRVDEDADRPLMLLPCAALRDRRCTVYAHRPQCCRTFECRLLRDAGRGAVSTADAVERIEEARARVARVVALLDALGRRDVMLPLRERCADALAVHPGSDTARKALHAELSAAMADVDEALRRSFLDRDEREGRVDDASREA
jgi:Fe-S-cluster containining protein